MDEVKVTQADREAVDAFHRDSFRALFETTDEGSEDQLNRAHKLLCQAFAHHRQQAERAFEERERKLREALKEISELHGEINPCNYDHDDACELNRQFCYALTVADLALKETPDAQ